MSTLCFENFLRDYMFVGNLFLSFQNKNDFRVRVYEYDPENGSFVGSGKDPRGISALIGKFNPVSSSEVRAVFSQTFYSGFPQVYFNGMILKEEDGICFRGNSTGSEKISFDLEVSPFMERARFGWIEHALLFEFPLPKKN